MKFVPSSNTVISTNESKKFTFQVNAKSFSILSSGLYKNKIKAVIREYSTNALDSHLEANNPESFEVHLPTRKECYFYIRDYGTGLSEEDFENTYFSVFNSTKDTNNNFNGCLGLGNLCGLSYNTKSFTVESWKDGYHYIYSCFIGRSGIPEFSQLLKEYSQEPEGVKVQLSVDPNNIEEFKENAQEVYKYFQTKPKFIGEQITLEDVYGDFNGLYSVRKNVYYSNSGSFAVMGNVAYPIENNFGLNDHQNILNSNLLIFFDIGELTFTPSRESLEYTDYTIKALKNKFKNILDTINDDITKKINSAKSEFEAVKMFNSIYANYGSNIKGLKKPNFLIWNNKTLNTDSIKIINKYFDFSRKAYRYKDTISINDCNYVINDLKTGAITRCMDLRTKNTKITYLIEPEDLKNLGLQYNDSDFIKASSLPASPRQIVKRSSLSSFSEMEDTYYITNSWKPIDIKDAKSKYYVVRTAYRAIFNNDKITSRDLYEFAKNAGINDVIYGVSKKEEQKVIDLGFININDAIKEKGIKTREELEKDIEEFRLLNSINELVILNNYFFDNVKKTSSKYDISKSPSFEMLELSRNLDKAKLKKFIDKVSFLNKIGESFNRPLDNDLLERYQKIIDKYSLLNHQNYGRISVSDYHYYILGVDHVKNI